MSDKIDVLDHGFARLVDHMGSDVSVVRAARVSHDADWRAGEDDGSDARLIGYLLTHRHSTPFEAVTLTFEVKLPLFLARQWHRHRTWSYNEVSARYTELPDDFYVPRPEHVGQQSASTKQARELLTAKEGVLGFAPDPKTTDQVNLIHAACESAFGVYRTLLASGVPRELARVVLPTSTYTRFFATVNLHNLLRFLELRLDPHAQWEIRQYAQVLLALAEEVVPVTMRTWERLHPELARG